MLAKYPAPNPLSMFTTTTPGEQEFSIVSKGAMPLNEAPYPTEVGTAIIGLPNNPDTTLGSTPSIPATTTSTLESSILFLLLNNRCSPATPTSYSLSTLFPIASATTAASSATFISDVPAVMTRIFPFLVICPLLLIIIVFDFLLYCEFFNCFLTALNISSVALVARTVLFFFASLLTISSTCFTVLFWQNTTSGNPFLKSL